jgi:hypothetical protein
MNKKAQVQSIIYFTFIIMALIVIGLIVMFIINIPLTKFSSAIGNVSSKAGTNVSGINTKVGSIWDYVIMSLFMLNVIILLISSFLVDTHPLFIFLYIIAVFLLIIFAPNVLVSVEKIWNNPQFATTSALLPMTAFLKDNFIAVLLGIVVLSGVIMYAKFKMFGNTGIGGSY